MVKSLTDQGLKEQIKQLNRGQLEDYLIQVVRKLEEYQAEELTKEGRGNLEKLTTEKTILEEKNKSLGRDNITLNQELKRSEERQFALQGERDILKADQLAQVQVFHKLNREKEKIETNLGQVNENLAAAKENIINLKKQLKLEKEGRKLDKRKITELENYRENLTKRN